MRWIGLSIPALLLVISLSFSRCGGDSNLVDTVALAPAVNELKVAEEYYNKKVQLKTRVFYGAHEFKWMWLNKRKPEKIFEAFVDEIKESPRYGFSPEDYHISELEQGVQALYDNRNRTNENISALDIRITASFFLFTTHLIEGRVRYPGAKEFLWKKGMPLENDIALLIKMESASGLRKALEDLHPKDPLYVDLQKVLRQYRELSKADTLPVIYSKLKLTPGESHEQIPLIRNKLRITTDYSGNTKDTLRVYDEPLVEAVKQFQVRHGLSPDGIISSKTISVLNIPLKEKTERIALNLERLRWLPHIQGKKDEIVINVPEYMLRVYQNQHEKMKMRVILGAEYTPTPVFHDTLKYIVFSPTWMVPKSIFEKEFLPKLRDNPGYFPPERFRFFKDEKEIDPYMEPWSDDDLNLTRYRVVENPGDENSLGKVKFIMPNDFSIYLHDTPAGQLFEKQERALSHGCVRVERPADLAQYLLSDQPGWNKKKIEDAMNAEEPVKVDIAKPYPVYIVYRTVWVDDKDLVNFREDIYGHDKRQLTYLKRQPLAQMNH